MRNKMLLVGGTGGVGTKLKKLFEEKYNVTSVGSKDLDVTNFRKLETFFHINEFDIIINLSGYNFDCFLHRYDEENIHEMKKQIDESNLDEGLLNKQEAIILAMTPNERDNPKIIGGSRKKRIANGSGTDISMVNKLLKQHKMMTNVMKKMSKGGRGALQGLDGIPPELLNNLK